jgi:hypothetical protein
MAFKIVFTCHGDHCATWPGYATRAEARAALRDADLIIPVWWDHEVIEETPATQPQEA